MRGTAVNFSLRGPHPAGLPQHTCSPPQQFTAHMVQTRWDEDFTSVAQKSPYRLIKFLIFYSISGYTEAMSSATLDSQDNPSQETPSLGASAASTSSFSSLQPPPHSIAAIVPCRDLDVSTAFYAKLGLQLVRNYGDYRILSDGKGLWLHLRHDDS